MNSNILTGNTKLCSTLLIILFFCLTDVIGQEVLDVLPIEGRNELFHDYLMEEIDVLDTLRKTKLAEALASLENFELRQERLRNDYRMLLGDLPDKTPLDPEIMYTIEQDGYNIDVLTYQSRPDHHVTANFYYPTTGDGPWPGILVTIGHYSTAKTYPLIQNIGITLAKNGFAALLVDPICQGERYQIINPADGNLRFVGESGTKQHTRLDVGAMLTGTSVAAYELWDNHRGIDYLTTRPEVDTSRIGCTGSSGGGAQATYLSAYDTRIKVAAVNSYLMNEPTLFNTIGPQTGSQNLSYEGLYGIDHPEYIAMFAPKPFMILCATQDFFDIEGTRKTYAESQQVYDRLGVPEKLGYFEYNDGHGYSKPKREAATRWFRTWFYSDTDTIIEPEDQATLSGDTLEVTESGQVFYEYGNEVVVEQLNADLAHGYADDRSNFWSIQTKDSCLNMVKELIHLEETPGSVSAEIVEIYDRGTYDVEKIKVTSGNLTPVTGLMFIPHTISGKVPAVLYVDGRGKNTDATDDGIIEKVYIDSGKIVFAVDIRGFGETADNPAKNEAKHGNNEHRNAVISGYVGKTLIGQRVQDINMAKMYLHDREETDTNEISIVGIDRAGTSVLHAAALDEDYKEVVIRNWTDTSWISMVETPTALNNLTHVVPNALKYYDLPDLVSVISPRVINYDKSLNSRLLDIKVNGGELDPQFSSETFEYNIIDITDDQIRISVSPYNEYTDVSITGEGTFPVGETDTIVQIIVTADNDVDPSIYNITIPGQPNKISSIEVRKESSLRQNYPNPFDGYTVITYTLASPGKVTIKIFNSIGKEVKILVDEFQMPNEYKVILNGNGLKPDNYYYQFLLDDKKLETKKMTVIKK